MIDYNDQIQWELKDSNHYNVIILTIDYNNQSQRGLTGSCDREQPICTRRVNVKQSIKI